MKNVIVKSSETLAASAAHNLHSFPPLEFETRTVVPTAAAAHHLMRKKQTLRAWACKDSAPIHPIRINGRLAWAVADIRRLLSGE